MKNTSKLFCAPGNPGIAQNDVSPFPRAAPSDPEAPVVRSAAVQVDASVDRGDLRRIWRSIGYDEINWTYTPTGRRLLRLLLARCLAAAGRAGEARAELAGILALHPGQPAALALLEALPEGGADDRRGTG